MRVLILAMVFVTVYSQEHFIDVRELVRDTIDAIKEVANNETSASTLAVETSTKETATLVKADEGNDVYKSLLKLPADIMSRLAYGAGFVEPKKTTAGETKVAEKAREAEPSKQPQDDAPSSSSSFRTVEDEQVVATTTKVPGPAKIIDDDVFSISKLISATGNALREAHAQQAALAKQQEPVTLPPLVPLPQPLEMPSSLTATLPLQQSEVVYRPVVRDGKTVFEQIVLLKSADGTTKIISQNVYPTLPVPAVPEQKKMQITKKVSKSQDYGAPTFPPMVNVFDTFSSSTTQEPSTTTTTEEPTTTTEEPTTTEVVKPRRKSLPRRTINYMGKKVQDMHSRQFGAKTVQMTEPIDFETQREEVPNVLEKEGSLRVRTINRKRKYRKTLIKKVSPKEEQLDEAAIAEIPKKRRRVIRRKNIKKIEEVKEKKEIRRFPDLYDEQQQKIEVAPSVSPATEDFTEEFKDVDEVQQQVVAPQNDSPIVEKKVKKELTAAQEEAILDKEIHKRVLKRIQSARAHSAETETEEYDEQPSTTTTTTTTSAPAKRTKKRVLITRQQCLNLRSFARQFLFDSVAEFAKEHCLFIENYYPNLKCEKVERYISGCQRLVKDDE
ncbi:unnamed protein product [Caenorhabditis angaria]|uniref:aECM cysteine-cradle domain-containing protein n=1 Tax=Caenorhabditis angaria TaxID=860376 RepID=A0A9P1IPK3_9PELO|nr:unnamed protein product [Caenorhabditis angaria]